MMLITIRGDSASDSIVTVRASAVGDREESVRCPLWLPEATERLRALNDGWDADVAPAPTETAINCLRTLAIKADLAGMKPDRIVPDVDGGAVLYFMGRDKQYGSIECGNDGSVFLVMSDDDAPVEEIEFTETGLKEALTRIARFLAA